MLKTGTIRKPLDAFLNHIDPILLIAHIIFSSFFLLLITAVLFLIKIPISSFHFPLSFLIGILFSNFLFRKKTENSSPFTHVIINSFVTFMLVIISLIISGFFFDMSGDGQAYHQPVIYSLAEGWNPFYLIENPTLDFTGNHFTKASWFLAASVLKLTGNIEYGKAFNILFLVAAFFTAYSVLSHFKRISQASRFWLSLLAAFSPVISYQLFSYYNDGLLAECFTILLGVLILTIIKDKKQFLAVWFACGVILINIKFTGLVYFCVFCVIAWFFFLIKNKKFPFLFTKVSLGCLLVGLIIIGFQPYVTNTINYKDPFYPVLGDKNKGLPHVEAKQASPEFMKKNRFLKLAMSLLSESRNTAKEGRIIDWENVAKDKYPKFKIPFTLSKKELFVFAQPDTRFAGSGPFFSGVFLCVSIFILLSLRRSSYSSVGFFLFSAIFLTAVINPEMWWSRLAPQIWLVMIIALVMIFNQGKWKLFRRFIMFALIVNVLLVFSVHVGTNFIKTMDLRGQIRYLKKLQEHHLLQARIKIRAHSNRLKAAGIVFEEVEQVNCDKPMNLVGGGAAEYYESTLLCIKNNPDFQFGLFSVTNVMRMMKNNEISIIDGIKMFFSGI